MIKNALTKYGLIFLLIALIIGAAIWMFFFLSADMDRLTAEEHGLIIKIAELTGVTMMANDFESDFGEAVKRLEEFERIFPSELSESEYQNEIIRVIENFEGKSGFNILRMDPQGLQYDALNQPTDENDRKTASSPKNIMPPEAGKGMKFSWDISFTSSYTELKEFVTLMHEMEQRIGIRQIKIESNRDNMIKGSMVLEFYGFMPEDAPEK